MTSRTHSDILANYACALQNAAPREWAAFTEVFDAYATDVTVAVTNADQNEILVAQGRARAFIHLLTIFRTCQTWAAAKSKSSTPQQPTQQP